MDTQKYNTLNKIGSVPLKGMEICLNEMLAKGIILENYTVEELLKLCKDFTKAEFNFYNSNKRDNYSYSKSVVLE